MNYRLFNTIQIKGTSSKFSYRPFDGLSYWPLDLCIFFEAKSLDSVSVPLSTWLYTIFGGGWL